MGRRGGCLKLKGAGFGCFRSHCHSADFQGVPKNRRIDCPKGHGHESIQFLLQALIVCTRHKECGRGPTGCWFPLVADLLCSPAPIYHHQWTSSKCVDNHFRLHNRWGERRSNLPDNFDQSAIFSPFFPMFPKF